MHHLPTASRPICVAVVIIAFIAAACGSSAAASPSSEPTPATSARAPSGSPSAVPSESSPTSTPASPSNSPNPAGSLPTQTLTDWGKIWDALPPAFPSYPQAEAASGTTTTPASATLTIPSTDAQTVATWYATALGKAGYSTEALAGPLENGERVVNGHGTSAACQLQVQVTPLGDVTSIVVLFGAACPFR